MFPRLSQSHRVRLFSAAAAVLLLGGAFLGNAPASMATFAGESAPATQPVRLLVHHVTLQRLTADHAELSVDAEVVPGVNARLDTVRLSQVHLNGTAVHVDPLEGQFVLRSGTPLELPRVRMVLYYTDLPTPSALDDMLAKQHVRITAEVRAELQVSVLSKLFTGEMHPVAALAIDEETSFDRAAVAPGIRAGVGLLSLAQEAFGTTTTIVQQLTGMRVGVAVNPVSEAEQRRLLVVRTAFRTRHSTQPQICERLGFWLDAEHALVPAEAMKPWAYSVEAAERSADTRDNVDPASVHTSLLPLAVTSTQNASSIGEEVDTSSVLQSGRPQESRLISPSGKPITVLDRSSLGNYALVHVDGRSRSQSRADLPADTSSSDAGDATTLRVYRYSGDLASGVRSLDFDRDASTRMIAGSLHPLPRPVDSRMFGSPVLLGDEVVGMVVDETAWISLPVAGRGDIESSAPATVSDKPTKMEATQTGHGRSAGDGNGKVL